MIIYKTPILSNYTSSFTNTLKEVYEVVDGVPKKGKKVDKKQQDAANLSCLEIMLKYKLVEKDTVKECINSGKLEKIEGMDELLK